MTDGGKKAERIESARSAIALSVKQVWMVYLLSFKFRFILTFPKLFWFCLFNDNLIVVAQTGSQIGKEESNGEDGHKSSLDHMLISLKIYEACILSVTTRVARPPKKWLDDV